MASNNSHKLQVTSGKAWRQAREEGVEVRLRMGHVARIRPVPLLALIKRGEVPDNLTPIALATLLGDPEDSIVKQLDAVASGDDDDVDELFTSLEFIDFLCKEAFVNPKIVEDPVEDDEIAIEDVSYEDRGMVAQLVLQPAEVLEKFRGEQVADVDDVSNGEGDEDEAK